jgi:hypothetical protein
MSGYTKYKFSEIDLLNETIYTADLIHFRVLV